MKFLTLAICLMSMTYMVSAQSLLNSLTDSFNKKVGQAKELANLVCKFLKMINLNYY